MDSLQPEKWTKEYVEQRLSELPPVVEEDESGDADLNWAFRKAAAVLSSFLPRSLTPVDEPLPDKESTLGQLLADSILIYDEQNKSSWTLRDTVRIEALTRLGNRSAMKSALQQNTPPGDQLQKMLSAYISNDAPAVSEQSLEQLSCTLQVICWLDTILHGLPLREEVRHRIEFENLLKPFRDLVGDHFRGRAAELQQLRDYVGVLPPGSFVSAAGGWIREFFSLHEKPPLLIYGPGGMGKSTLVAKFILEHAELDDTQRFPFVYIDFDRPGLMVEKPLTLLMEAARQFAIQYPEARAESESLLKRWRQQQMMMSSEFTTADSDAQWTAISGSGDMQAMPGGSLEESVESISNGGFYESPLNSTDGPSYSVPIKEFKVLLDSFSPAGKYFLMVLDTFEEVQYRSKDYVGGLWNFIEELQRQIPRLRTVLAGRAPITEFKFEPLVLDRLDPEAALGFLQHHGINDVQTASALAEQLRGNPLSLRLAVELLKKENRTAGKGGIQGLETHRLFFLSLREERIQGQLFRRILNHIHDEDVRKLAHPGLVLRRITPELIEEVLAKPCGVKVENRVQARRLFAELSKEVALVAPAEHGALRHRTDVRRVMLDLLIEDDKERVEKIHRRAIDYYKQQRGVVARAEEVYHRLALGQSSKTIDGRWREGIEEYLNTAIEELPNQSKAYLASRLGLSLDEQIFAQAELEIWERHTEQQAAKLLNIGQPKEALKAIRARAERTPESPLHLIEARALELLKRFVEAQEVVERGIRAAVQSVDEEALFELLLIQARLNEKMKNFNLVRLALAEAREITLRLGDDIKSLRICVREFRLMRLSGRSNLNLLAGLRDETLSLLDKIPDHQLLNNTGLLGLLVQEIGAQFPEVTTKVLRLIGAGNLYDQQRPLLAKAFTLWELDLSKEAQQEGVLMRSAGLGKISDAGLTWKEFVWKFPLSHIAKTLEYLIAKYPLTIRAAGPFGQLILDGMKIRGGKPVLGSKSKSGKSGKGGSKGAARK